QAAGSQLRRRCGQDPDRHGLLLGKDRPRRGTARGREAEVSAATRWQDGKGPPRAALFFWASRAHSAAGSRSGLEPVVYSKAPSPADSWKPESGLAAPGGTLRAQVQEAPSIGCCEERVIKRAGFGWGRRTPRACRLARFRVLLQRATAAHPCAACARPMGYGVLRERTGSCVFRARGASPCGE